MILWTFPDPSAVSFHDVVVVGAVAVVAGVVVVSSVCVVPAFARVSVLPLV